jgi:hypothetical protein
MDNFPMLEPITGPVLTVAIGDTTHYGSLESLREKGIAESSLLLAYKTAKLSQLADNRWHKEVSGIVWNTYPVHTDRESQSRITAAYVMAKNQLWSDGAIWKFADGISRPMNGNQIQEIAQVVITHVQSAFEIESIKIAQITAATDFEAVDAIDLTI